MPMPLAPQIELYRPVAAEGDVPTGVSLYLRLLHYDATRCKWWLVVSTLRPEGFIELPGTSGQEETVAECESEVGSGIPPHEAVWTMLQTCWHPVVERFRAFPHEANGCALPQIAFRAGFLMGLAHQFSTRTCTDSPHD